MIAARHPFQAQTAKRLKVLEPECFLPIDSGGADND